MNYKQTWHGFHLIMSLLTGFWVVIWIYCALSNSQHNKRVLFNKQMEK